MKTTPWRKSAAPPLSVLVLALLIAGCSHSGTAVNTASNHAQAGSAGHSAPPPRIQAMVQARRQLARQHGAMMKKIMANRH